MSNFDDFGISTTSDYYFWASDFYDFILSSVFLTIWSFTKLSNFGNLGGDFFYLLVKWSE